jgi:hypothetical protein
VFILLKLLALGPLRGPSSGESLRLRFGGDLGLGLLGSGIAGREIGLGFGSALADGTL